MGNVAVLLIPRLRIPIVQPFLQLALLANLQRGESGAGLFQLLAELRLGIQDFGGLDAVGE